MSRRVSHLGGSAAPLLVTVLVLAGCQQRSQTSMDLLRAGDPAVCTASDVEDTLRALIRPEGLAAEGYTIAFADASLEAFDKGVARATCNAALTVDGPNGPVIERTMIDYVVAPAAKDPDSFIVSGATGPLRQRLADAISDDASDQAERDSQRQAQDAFVALVKPGWLIGRWVDAARGSWTCREGPYDDYERGGRVNGATTTGRWQLRGQQLSVVLPTASATLEITAATADTFDAELNGNDQLHFRRCSAAEMQPAAAPDPVEPEPEQETTPAQEAEPPPQ